MAEAIPGPAPQGEQLRALLEAPEHCLARLARDLFATPSACAATTKVCANYAHSNVPGSGMPPAMPACQVCSGRTDASTIAAWTHTEQERAHTHELRKSASLRACFDCSTACVSGGRPCGAGSYHCNRAACGARRAVRAGPLLRGVSWTTAARASGHRGGEPGEPLPALTRSPR